MSGLRGTWRSQPRPPDPDEWVPPPCICDFGDYDRYAPMHRLECPVGRLIVREQATERKRQFEIIK